MSALTQLSVALPSHPPSVATTHTALLTALSSSTSLSHLKQVHAQILRLNLSHSHTLLINILLSSCSLSSLDYALSVFSHFPTPPPPLSIKFLRALSRSAKPQYTLFAYEKIRGERMGVDRFSFPPLLKAAGKVSGLNEGKEIHGLAAKMGFDTDLYVQTGLLGMYAACGRIMEARLVFDKMSQRDVVTWSIMMDGYEN